MVVIFLFINIINCIIQGERSNILFFFEISNTTTRLLIMILHSFFSPPSLDPESKEQLVEVIEKLLGDKTTVRKLLLLTF